jgi:basic membrane protein A
MAGLVTTRDKIGFVGGMDIPLINKFAGGYIWGANWSNPGINFTIAYTGDWVNTAAGKSLADGMYAAGFDIIFAAAGRSGLGVIESTVDTNVTKAYPVWAIGVDSPQMYLGLNEAGNRTVVLTSMLKRVDTAIYRQFEQVFLSTWTAGLKFGTVANGLVGYELNVTIVDLPPEVYTTVYGLENQIAAGTVTVPDTKYWL